MKIADVIRKTNSLIKQHGAVTVRQVYYQLYPKFHSDYKNANSFYTSFDRMLVTARENRDVPVANVIDTARTTMGGDVGCSNVDSYIKNSIEAFLDLPDDYSLRRWDNQPVTPVIWIEKDALSRIVHAVADEYNVMTCPSRGYSSFHYLWKTIVENENIKFLHFSDHDPSGLDMKRDLEERAWKYAGRRIPVERVGLTFEQVEEYDLPSNPTKRADSRRRSYVEEFGNECWELDALPPNELKRLVRESIEKEIEQKKWEETEEKEKEDREQLEEQFKKFGKALEDVELVRD